MNSAGIARAQVIALRLLLILVHFHGFAHISSCAFKEQDLAARQAVAFAVGEKRGEESWELISLLLCIADCFVCSVDACLSPTVLITSYQFQEMGQMCTKEFVFCVTADFFFLTVKWLVCVCWMCCLKWKKNFTGCLQYVYSVPVWTADMGGDLFFKLLSDNSKLSL